MSGNNLRLGSSMGTGCTAGKHQSFRFELYSDGTLYSTVFEGNVSQADANRILQEIHSHLYKESSEVIRTYLKSHHISYSKLHSGEIFLEHEKIMTLADVLLHSDSPDTANGHIRDADNYYAVADHQKMTRENVCEGCYFAARKIPCSHSDMYAYRIIGQTFRDNCYGCNSSGYFAIRTAKSNQQFQNLDELSGRPVLPSFGCVDVIRLLMNIDIITTPGQAEEFAL